MAKPITKTTNKIDTKVNTTEKINDIDIEKVKETDKEEEIKALKLMNETKDKEIDKLSTDIANLQQQFNLLMQQVLNSNMNKSEPEHEEVVVGCRGIYNTVLCTNDNKILYNFNCNEEKIIDVEDLKILFKESIRDNRLLFEEDTLYFKDPENYKRFNIKKKVDLSAKNIVRILTLPTHDMINEVNNITNNLTNFRLTHSLQFEIVKLLLGKENLLKDWSYENRHALEKYIGQKFDDLMAAVGAIELLGRQNFKNL